jgi:hypothetical protein
MHFLQDSNPRRLATGSLRELGIVELFERATGAGSYFDQIITSRAQHDCIRRPCWGNCFGLWNGAENSFVNNVPPALLTTGMHGTEHRGQERWTIRLSAPRLLVCPTTGSKLPGTPQPVFLPNGTGRS